MCGITAVFCRESVIASEYLDTLFSWTEKRGQDGFGCVLIKKNRGRREIAKVFKSHLPYSKCKNKVLLFLKDEVGIGDLIIAISRAAPETEPATNPEDVERTLQPIVRKDFGLVVVHNGAVSNMVYQNLKNCQDDSTYHFKTDIDSEAIIAAYLIYGRNIKNAFEYLSGGFASIIYDQQKDMLYVINDFKPIAHGYIRGVGFILHSDNDAIGEVIQSITSCPRDGIAMWETWYHHYLGGGRIKEIDLDSGFIRNIKYSPRYITQNWDSNNERNEMHAEVNQGDVKVINPDEVCLVSCSGGLDSSTTLAILKLAGYKNIYACHFKYGHRGQNAEEIAITRVCEKLKIPLKIFDIQDLMKSIDVNSMLMDKNAPITTGTKEGLKKLDAWVNCRNMQFLTWMATYAESLVMKYEFKKVYFLGGFLNLSESGHYPDNSEYFLNGFLEFVKYGSLIGNRIQPMYCLSNLMKHELFVLIQHFNLMDIYKETISCDRPAVDTPTCDHLHLNHIPEDAIHKGVACNCMANGIPACGSGLLSYWAAKMVGLDDTKIRNFYNIPSNDDYEAYIPEHMKTGFSKKPDINEVINRILLPKDKLDNLKKLVKEIKHENRINS
jgi:7-cyano-7-deazaguanine synthase in queuosine biosynthesis/predicted glutamine amidotransferase